MRAIYSHLGLSYRYINNNLSESNAFRTSPTNNTTRQEHAVTITPQDSTTPLADRIITIIESNALPLESSQKVSSSTEEKMKGWGGENED